jgi:hypothetical protein
LQIEQISLWQGPAECKQRSTIYVIERPNGDDPAIA